MVQIYVIEVNGNTTEYSINRNTYTFNNAAIKYKLPPIYRFGFVAIAIKPSLPEARFKNKPATAPKIVISKIIINSSIRTTATANQYHT